MSAAPDLRPPANVFLLPQEIHVLPGFEVWGDLSEGGVEPDNDKELRDLAESLDRDGQIDAVKVVPFQAAPDAPIRYVVISGHRRRRAAMLVNEVRSRECKPLMRLRCEIDETTDPTKQLRRAVSANSKRRGYTVLHLAATAKRLLGNDGDLKKVSATLGAKQSVLTEALKLYDELSADTRRRVMQGEISVQSAKVLGRTVDPDFQDEVVNRARDIQDDAAINKAVNDVVVGGRSLDQAAARAVNKLQQDRIELPAVQQAISERTGSPVQKKTLKDVREFFEGFDAPVYGAQDSPVRLFAQYFATVWMQGAGKDAAARKKLEACFAPAATKGTPAPKPVKKKAVAKRTSAKKKGTKRK